MANETGEGASGLGFETFTRYLEEKGIAYEPIEHEATYTAADEAQAAGVTPDHAAKTMVLRDGDQYRLAVLPASERLDVRKAREALEASSHLRLATEEEMEADFAEYEVGAVPPVGPTQPAPEVLDQRLLDHERIICTAGDHRHSVLVDPREIARIADAQVVDVCKG